MCCLCRKHVDNGEMTKQICLFIVEKWHVIFSISQIAQVKGTLAQSYVGS